MAEAKCIFSGTIYSSRERVNIIMPNATNAEGNNFFPPARGNVHLAIAKYLDECFERELPVLSERWPNAALFVSPDHGVRGKYNYTIWSE